MKNKSKNVSLRLDEETYNYIYAMSEDKSCTLTAIIIALINKQRSGENNNNSINKLEKTFNNFHGQYINNLKVINKHNLAIEQALQTILSNLDGNK